MRYLPEKEKDRDIEPMQLTAISSAGAHFGIDVVGPLPRTMRGNRYIVVAIDYLTKWTEARAIQLADALTIAPFIYEDIICRHGIPREVTSDRGTEFVNYLVYWLPCFSAVYKFKWCKSGCVLSHCSGCEQCT